MSKRLQGSMDTAAVALLRGINVGGRALLRMSDLKALMDDLGYLEPQTLLQSGQVVFTLRDRPREKAGEIETQLEHALSARFSLQPDVFVRSASEWRELIAANPFMEQASTDPSHLLLMLLKEAPTAAAVKTLQTSIKGREVVCGHGPQLFIVYPDGLGTSKLSGNVIERALGTRGTMRNWNTVLKLGELMRLRAQTS